MALDLGPKQIQSGLVITNRKFVTRFQESGQTLVIEGELSNSGLAGTFSITGPQGGQSAFTGTRRVAGVQVDAGLGILSVQAGIVYKMGGAQAVARTTFHLLRKDLVDILTSAGPSSRQEYGSFDNLRVRGPVPRQQSKLLEYDQALCVCGELPSEEKGKQHLGGGGAVKSC